MKLFKYLVVLSSFALNFYLLLAIPEAKNQGEIKSLRAMKTCIGEKIDSEFTRKGWFTTEEYYKIAYESVQDCYIEVMPIGGLESDAEEIKD